MALPVSSRGARSAAGTRRAARSAPAVRRAGQVAPGALSGAARRRLDRGLDVLGRLVPLACRLSRLVGSYVAVVAAAVATIVTTLAWRFWPESLDQVLVHGVLACLLAVPVVVLWLFHRALAEVVQIPSRLAAAPSVARDRAGELAVLVREAQLRRGGLRLSALPRDLWRAGRLLLAAHDELPGYGAVLTIVSVPFLLAALAAAVAGLVEIVLAPAVVVGAVVTALA